MTPPDVPADAGHVAVLASLSGVGPSRLTRLLALGPADEVLDLVRRGGLAPDRSWTTERLAAWRAEACGRSPEVMADTMRSASMGLVRPGDDAYPDWLRADPAPPPALFVCGDLGLVTGPRVAIVGTRRCTRYGRDTARSLGRQLARLGVGVVSGLAAGIDGAAHHGALESGPGPVVGIVGSGLDVVYPPRHGELWHRVATVGVLLSEAPPGARPERWRFPARNRLIAAAAHAVVVVESHARGGALLTVDEALTRDRPVLSVPGPITSPASAGTNHLLGEGAAPCTSVDDVLLAIGAELVAGAPVPVGIGAEASRPEPSPVGAVVLDALGWEPASLSQLAERLPWPLVEVVSALELLVRDGHVAEADGWYERVAEHDRGPG